VTPYSTLMSRIVAGGGEAALEVPDDWLQGRTLFGGLQAAIALAAMRTVAPAAPLRTLQVTFIGPVPGGTVRAKARVLRTGKNTTHVEARIVDGESTLALAIAVFGVARPTRVVLPMVQAPVKSGNPVEMPYMAGVAPAFTQHFKARWLVGAPPFTRMERNPESVIEIGLRDSGTATEAHAIAMADFIPPVALSWLEERVAAASLTWMLEFLTADFAGLSLDGWRIDARMMAAGEGYTSQSLVLWGPGGVPVALGRQSMVVFG